MPATSPTYTRTRALYNTYASIGWGGSMPTASTSTRTVFDEAKQKPAGDEQGSAAGFNSSLVARSLDRISSNYSPTLIKQHCPIRTSYTKPTKIPLPKPNLQYLCRVRSNNQKLVSQTTGSIRPLCFMASLEFLATELLLDIVQYVAETPEEFTTIDGSREQPPLKNLSSTSKRLRAVCFPFLFRSVKLSLENGHTRSSIKELRGFIRDNSLEQTIESMGLAMGPEWNEGKVGLELKKFLWEISVKSLSVRQHRTPSLREKSARWPYFLTTLERLRLEEVDDDNDLKMLLLRQCPIRLLHVNDGNFRSLYEDDNYFEGDAEYGPGIASFKSSVFPNLTTVVYHAAWPPFNRFDGFLEFVARLSVIEVLEVKLMGDEDLELDLERKAYKILPDAVRWAEMVSAYQILAWRVGTIDSLQRLVVRDHRIPYHGKTDPPQSFTEGPVGTYQKQKDAQTQ